MTDLMRTALDTRRTGFARPTGVTPETATCSAPGEVATRGPRLPRRFMLHPLSAILAVQAGLSLTLIWANTAFTDEAEYLWGGHLEIAHWLHGTPLPPTLAQTFSGSPIIYPPLGAIADGIGGLAAARLLSLIFMLAATILLYLVASRLLGRTAALFSCAVWAISEPVIRLGAFASYDAISILAMATSVWLALQVGFRRRRGEFVAAAAASLALANATAYSTIVIDPIVIAFAFVAWLPAIGAKQARFCAAWLIGAYAILFTLIMTASRSWAGFAFTIVFRKAGTFVNGTSAISTILAAVWSYSGACIVLAAIGTVIALSAESQYRRVLLVLAACAIVVVPAGQIYNFTDVSLDKHLAYGIWFAAIAAGYGCNRLLESLSVRRLMPAIVCFGLAFAYPAADSWEAAWYKQHGWSNASRFVSALRRVVGRTRGLIDASSEEYVAMYYTSEGRNWTRWNRTDLSLDPPGIAAGGLRAYYARILDKGGYGVIALFYTTTLKGLPVGALLSTSGYVAQQQVLNIVASDTGSANGSERGLPALTICLEHDPAYRLDASGSSSSITVKGVFTIWQRKSQT
ncbi:MAG: hypothetical protein ABR946_00350 [Solirubrobacteraceae bacterium]